MGTTKYFNALLVLLIVLVGLLSVLEFATVASRRAHRNTLYALVHNLCGPNGWALTGGKYISEYNLADGRSTIGSSESGSRPLFRLYMLSVRNAAPEEPGREIIIDA